MCGTDQDAPDSNTKVAMERSKGSRCRIVAPSNVGPRPFIARGQYDAEWLPLQDFAVRLAASSGLRLACRSQANGDSHATDPLLASAVHLARRRGGGCRA